jgi:hypothetical protein
MEFGSNNVLAPEREWSGKAKAKDDLWGYIMEETEEGGLRPLERPICTEALMSKRLLSRHRWIKQRRRVRSNWKVETRIPKGATPRIAHRGMTATGHRKKHNSPATERPFL